MAAPSRDRRDAPRRRRALALAALAVALTRPVGAEEDRSLGTFRDWSAMAFGEAASRACMAFSQPRETKSDAKPSGEGFVFVTHRPADGTRGKVTFETTFPLQPDSQLAVVIGELTFNVFTDGARAWTFDEDDDRALVKAMRAGRIMEVRGRTGAGEATVETYSLLGFTAASRAIDSACR